MQSTAATEAFWGACGSAGACVISNPVDVVRTRLQLVGAAGSSSAGSLASSFSRLSAANLTTGLRAAIGYNVAFNGARFFLFDTMSSHTSTPVAGFSSGFVAGYLSSPLAKIRTVQQAGSCGASFWRMIGSKPFAGAGAWALRNGGHTGCIFTLYNGLRQRLREALPAGSAAWAVNLLASLQAATASCLLMNPVDVVATRLFHEEGPSRQAGAPRFASPLGCARWTVAAEGLGGLYRGLFPRLVAAVPRSVCTVLAYEKAVAYCTRPRAEAERSSC